MVGTVTFVITFVERWLGGLSGVLLTFAGVLFCVLVVGAFWDRRIRMEGLFGWFTCGVTVVFYPLVTQMFHEIVQSQLGTIVVSLLGLLLAIFLFAYIQNRVGRNRNILVEQTTVKSSIFSKDTAGRTIRGSKLGVPLVILIGFLAVLGTGLSAPQVMVGDEVTHYYMLTHQAEDLSKPNFFAEIPTATGAMETRRYPHSFLWHYIGALIFWVTGGSFAAIQLYQALFFVQMLVVAYLLAKDRQGVESRAALVYVLLLGSLPLCLIFSVAYYQDVPMTAQVLTSFYLLRRHRWFLASVFMSFAIGFKVTATLFYPAFFLLLFCWQVKKSGWLKGIATILCSLMIVLGSTWALGRAIVTFGHAEFYPQAKLERILQKTKHIFESNIPVVSKVTGVSSINTNLSARPTAPEQVEQHPPVVIANHPGDLRVLENYFIYGGVVLFLVILQGLFGQLISVVPSSANRIQPQSGIWMYFVGGGYTLIAAWFIKTSPDARFFLPGLVFLSLPIVEKAVCLPKPKVFISLIAALVFLQGGYVLQKTYHLRALTPEIIEGIQFLNDEPPRGNLFMYPEGNYRFFPAPHEWYLGYRLREFWKANNDIRLEILGEYGVSLLVVKKHLIAPVDEQITNLGVYPLRFVQEIEEDPRFKKVFENPTLAMYRIGGVGIM